MNAPQDPKHPTSEDQELTDESLDEVAGGNTADPDAWIIGIGGRGGNGGNGGAGGDGGVG